MFKSVTNVFRGLVLNPLLVAFARGSAEAFVMGVLLIISDATYLEGVLPDELMAFIPLIVLTLRQAEGVADKLDPAKQRRRDALREGAVEAEVSGGTTGPLNPGDVQDGIVDAAVESIEVGDYS